MLLPGFCRQAPRVGVAIVSASVAHQVIIPRLHVCALHVGHGAVPILQVCQHLRAAAISGDSCPVQCLICQRVQHLRTEQILLSRSRGHMLRDVCTDDVTASLLQGGRTPVLGGQGIWMQAGSSTQTQRAGGRILAFRLLRHMLCRRLGLLFRKVCSFRVSYPRVDLTCCCKLRAEKVLREAAATRAKPVDMRPPLL